MSNSIDPSIFPGFTTSFPAVNTITIASIPLPGKWTLVSAPKKYGWQIQQQFGMSGAVVFPKGDPLVEATFMGEFWSNTDFTLFGPIRDKLLANAALKFPGGLFAAAMGVGHPELKALGVEQCVILEIDPVTQAYGGRWVTKLVLLQYRPPQPAVKKPSQVIPDVAPANATATTALEAQIQIQTATVQALAGAL